MTKIAYIEKNMQDKTLRLIEFANSIVDEYTAQGFSLTLRQLYYQLVSRDYIPNSDKSYSRLGSIINDARLCGMMDWESIEDRTRNLRVRSDWKNPETIIRAMRSNYTLNLWQDQEYAVEVWVEKDALVDVVSRACQPLAVPFFACRGYTSQSEMWAAGMRFIDYYDSGKIPVIIHLGDHDPSGIDMTRDITDRLAMFTGEDVEVNRIALNMDQIRQYSPPPNPAKLTDSRSNSYISEYGRFSWELDALEPAILVDMITNHIEEYITDWDQWDTMKEKEAEGKILLGKVSDQWSTIVENLS